MARSEAVPLLLLSLLLASAVGYEYYRLDQVSFPWASHQKYPDDCAGVCDAESFCSGYYRPTDGTCHIYHNDCRGPAINSSQMANGISYMAINKCPGTALAPCGCPDGFRRYGSRCLYVSDEPLDHDTAWWLCHKLVSRYASPRSEMELQQLNLAVADATSCSPQPVWVGVQLRGGVWVGSDRCGPISQPFWAVGQPDSADEDATLAVYVPPGVPDMNPGWHTHSWHGTYRAVCQLLYCHRPECVS